MGSEEAFLILKIGGVVSEKGFALKPSSQYHFQLQLQMFVSKLSLNILVVWTKKGVFAVDVPLNPSFMTKTCVPSLRYSTDENEDSSSLKSCSSQTISSAAQQP
ncbi:hypothetical protein pdam_00016593, partial [Pocillopora damicornis]